ncbi:hypothetical protein NL108_011115, partial [Scomber scombrus]
MDATESDQIRTALRAQGQKLFEQDQQFARLHHDLAEVTSRSEEQCATVSAQLAHVIDQLQRLTTTTSAEPPAAAPDEPDQANLPELRSLRLSSPERFSGDSEDHIASTTSPEPMQIGQTRLTPAERQRRFLEGRCIYCAQLGHVIAHCPVRVSRPSNAPTSL